MILSIDYGEKRVGVALSDASETLAFPHSVLKNSKTLARDVLDVARNEAANIIVLGYSSKLSGEDNIIQERIHEFKKELETVSGMPVIFEQEWLSSQEASRFTGTNDMIDASAAAVILQRFLDKKRFQK
jgi:putative Holliday junction resolvase